ncbi:hypothetical protein LLG95_14870 [bacterium]|nr:hypothetical protein [bacterium]
MSNLRYAQQVQFVKSRWPEIGRYVDHPLGEWFYERVQSQPWRRRYRPRRSTSIVLLILLLFLINIFGLILYFILRCVVSSKRAFRHMTQPAAYVNGRERALLPELWLTGIGFRDLAAIEILLSIATPLRNALWWIGQIVWAAIPCVLLYTVFIANSVKFGGTNAALAVSATVFWIELYPFVNNADRTAQRAIRDLLQDMRERHIGKVGMAARQFGKSVLGCAGVVILLVMVAMLTQEPKLFSWVLICFFIYGSVFIPFYILKIMPQKTQELFLSGCETGEEAYANAILSECEHDLALRRKS